FARGVGAIRGQDAIDGARLRGRLLRREDDPDQGAAEIGGADLEGDAVPERWASGWIETTTRRCCEVGSGDDGRSDVDFPIASDAFKRSWRSIWVSSSRRPLVVGSP